MISLLMEAVVISFTLGGVIGALIALHSVHAKNKGIGHLTQISEIFDSEGVLHKDGEARLRIPPRH
jgi:hypothetical protein